MADFKLKKITRRRAKRCYQLAGRAMIGDEVGRGARLVHGVIYPELSPGVRAGAIPHAWVEHRDKVWEPAIDQWMPAATFAALFLPKVGHRYSKKETARLLLERGHWGTWHDFPPYYWVL